MAVSPQSIGVEAAADPKIRPGERALTLLATPLNLLVLGALADQPMRLAELRQATGLPAQTTLRGHLAVLEEVGALRKKPKAQMPYTVENELTPMGEELLRVAESLEGWLQRAPNGPISLESGAAKGVVKAFVDGWGSTMMRSLGSRPMSLTELDREIPDLSYPALERRLSSMRMAGLIEAVPGTGSGTPYAITDWARTGIRPVAAAAHCERAHMGKVAAPVTKLDVEAAFLLATPLVDLPEESSGTCQLEVEMARGARSQAGVRVEVERGKVVTCECALEEGRSSYVAGSTTKWFTAIKEGSLEELRFGGGRHFGESLVLSLHATLMRN
ncbi:MAG TPA: winged helix-turn-helix transcriptional regulator [Solirubrobacterales bacterium]|nr:winged helix-turn-helix transcriptional regulator [Solirubrobacterales bacterium]